MEFHANLSGVATELVRLSTPSGVYTMHALRRRLCEAFEIDERLAGNLELRVGDALLPEDGSVEDAGLADGAEIRADIKYSHAAAVRLEAMGLQLRMVDARRTVSEGDWETLRLYLATERVDAPALLCLAARLGSEEGVRLVANQSAAEAHPAVDVNALSATDELPLTSAVRGGQAEAAALLLEMGAFPDGVRGRTPLSNASSLGHREIARLLLEKGADPNADELPKPPAGQPALTPLYRWASRRDAMMCAVLLRAGADPALPHPTGETCVSVAAPHVETLRVLLAAGAPANPEGRATANPLLSMAQADEAEACAVLLDHGAKATPEVLAAAGPQAKTVLLRRR